MTAHAKYSKAIREFRKLNNFMPDYVAVSEYDVTALTMEVRGFKRWVKLGYSCQATRKSILSGKHTIDGVAVIIKERVCA